MPKKLVMRLIIDGQEALILEGTKKGRKVNWEEMSKGHIFPPSVMSNKTVGETYDAITDYVDDLMRKGILQKQGYGQDYRITIDHGAEE